MTREEERELQEQLARLHQEHRDLDAAIAALQEAPGSDLLQVQRLKKRKLYLRDRRYFSQLSSQIPQLFGKDTASLCMEGDICRRDLLLEVEGIYAMPGAVQ